MRLLLKEWHFSDGSHSLNGVNSSSLHSLDGSASLFSKTGRKIIVTVLAGKNLLVSKTGKCDANVKLQYGKVSNHCVTLHVK